jgi:uncharacterized Tic20 family protein
MADGPEVTGGSGTPQQGATPDAAEKDARLWGMLCHLTALAGFIGIPFGNIIGPLVVWLMKRNEIPFVDEQGKEAVNFQISVILYAIVAGILILVLIGIPLLFGLVIFDIVMTIVASVKANSGQHFRYPISIRFIK